MSWIRLTNNTTNGPIFVNLGVALAVERDANDTYTRVKFGDPNATVTVKETPEQILAVVMRNA